MARVRYSGINKSYIAAYGVLERSRGGGKDVSRKSVMVMPNTRMYLDGKEYGDPIRIRLHGNPIIEIRDDNTWKLSSAGWHTTTTKDRLNKLTPANVAAKKGQWYVWPSAESPVKFYDGIVVNAEGMPSLPYSGYAATGRKPKTFKGSKRKSNPVKGFDVFLRGKKIDTVFYSGGAKVTTGEAKRSLVDHDGYDSEITVRRSKKW